MTDEQVEAALDYFRVLWPQSYDWPAESWTHWSVELAAHGPYYVRIAFRRLRDDPDFKRFAPGLAAMIQALNELEESLRTRLSYAQDGLAAAQEQGDAERVARVEEYIARIESHLAR